MTVRNVVPIELKMVSSHPSAYEVGNDIELTSTSKVEHGSICEPLFFVCMGREDDNTPTTDYLMPLYNLYNCYSEGETFDVPFSLPALPVGKYTIVVFFGHRQNFFQLYDFDVVKATGIVEMINDRNVNGEMKNALYDLQGRHVVKPTKAGMYIQNNKKVIIK